MRIALISCLLAFSAAGAALAQPADKPTDKPAPAVAATGDKADAVQTSEKAKSEEAQATAALAIAVRRAEDLERMARLACAAGDTSKCPKDKPAASPGSPSS